jgi:hypothetical protein
VVKPLKVVLRPEKIVATHAGFAAFTPLFPHALKNNMKIYDVSHP